MPSLHQDPGTTPLAIVPAVQRKIPDVVSRHPADLLQEVNHRASNSLQIAASILSLHARAATSGEVRMELQAAANRIGSIGLVHEQLYRANETESVNVESYFRNLISNIQKCYCDGESAQFSFQATGLPTTRLHPDAATKLGIIVTELLTNCVKYAGSQPTCSVAMSIEAGDLHVVVSDNGPGLNAGAGSVPGIGMDIVKTQIAQLKATMVTDFTKPGAHFVIVVPGASFAQ